MTANPFDLTGMMRTVALEYGRLGITANSVAAGWIATSLDESASYVAGQAVAVDGGNTIQEPDGIELYGSAEGHP
jgi:hypothetical protein